MLLNDKITIIKDFKEPAIAALNSYLDRIYSLTKEYVDENNVLKDNLQEDEKVYNFVCELKEDSVKYENVRRKLINNDFCLTLIEVNYIALAFYYSIETMKKQKETIETTINSLNDIVKKLIS